MSEIDDRLDRLESQLDQQQQRIDDQQETIEEQQVTIESQQATIEEQREQIADLKDDDSGTATTDAESMVLNRRNALKAGGLLALLFGSAGTASADPQGQVGTSSDPLEALYTDELYGNSGTVSVQDDLDLNGNNLTSTSVGTDVSVDVDSTVVDEADFALEIEDTGGTKPTVRWLRESIDDNALRVVTDDGQTVRTRLRLDDDGTLGVGGDITATTVSTGTLDNDGSPIKAEDNLDLNGNDLEDAGTTIWDSGNGYVPQGRLQNDSVTVSAGTGLTSGGSASLGGSTTLDVASDGIGTNELDAGAVAGSNLSGGGGTLDVDSTIVTDDLTLRGDVGDSNAARINLDSFASASGGNIDIIARNTVTCTGNVVPNRDTSWNLGESGTRWANVYAANGVSTSSDARLKQNVADLSDPLDRLRDIRPVSYEWNDQEDPDTRLGFVAQELDDAVPEAVDHPDDEDGYLGVTYDMVVPVAVGAIQKQQERIEELEAENEQLRERVEAIETELGIGAESDPMVADD